MTRRDFLAAAAVAPVYLQAGERAMMPIVDTHQHLWDLEKFTLPWVKPGDALHAQHTPKEYVIATDGLNVVKAVYMEVGMAKADQRREAEYVIDLCKNKVGVTCAAVIAGDPASPGFEAYVTSFKGSPFIKGVRHMLHVDGVKASDGLTNEFRKGLQLLGDLGMSFDFCIRPHELPEIVKIVESAPATRFILDHCGNPNKNFSPQDTDSWKRGLEALAAKKNIVCKVSGIVANGFKKGQWKPEDLAPFINIVLDTFGPDRVMFGGDWPVCTRGATYAEWVNALKAIVANRSASDQAKLFHDNAVKFYGLA